MVNIDERRRHSQSTRSNRTIDSKIIVIFRYFRFFLSVRPISDQLTA